MSAEAVKCPGCGFEWRSQTSRELILQERCCPACRAPLDLSVPEFGPRPAGAAGAVAVLDEAPARLEEVGFIDEAALLDRTFEALRRESRQARARAQRTRQETHRVRARLAGQRQALRWTLLRLARRGPLDARQRRLLTELNDELRRAERLLEPR